VTGRFGEEFVVRPDFPTLFFDAEAARWFSSTTARLRTAVHRWGFPPDALEELYGVWARACHGHELVLARGPHELHLYGRGDGNCPVRPARLIDIRTLAWLGPAEITTRTRRSTWWRLV
jgi:hypothetical protein